MMKNEFRFLLRGGYLAVVVFFITVLVIFTTAALSAQTFILRFLAVLLAACLVGLLWYGYNQSFGGRTVLLEGNCLVVTYWLGKQVRFTLPEAVKGVAAYAHDRRSDNPDNLQLVLREKSESFLLNISCFENAPALCTALDAVIPMSRCFQDGRVEPLRLSEVKRGTNFVDVVGKSDEVTSKLGGKLDAVC